MVIIFDMFAMHLHAIERVDCIAFHEMLFFLAEISNSHIMKPRSKWLTKRTKF